MIFTEHRPLRAAQTAAAGLCAVAAALCAVAASNAPAYAAGRSAGPAAAATARIQGLLDHPVGGTVNLPAGTFTVRPDLRLQRGVKIVGHHTTLKVAPGSGNYLAMLAGASAATDLSGLTVTGVTFDQNPRGNPVTSKTSLLHGKPRFVILASAGTGLTIAGNRFTGADDVNTIVTGGGTSDVRISGNTFATVNPRGHDHSSVYTAGRHTRIVQNVFTGRSVYSSAAIEIHGDGATVTGNRISGYPRGANIACSHAVFSGNTIRGALSPVDLWSVASPGLSHATVTHNTLGRDLRHWARVYRQHGSSLPAAKYTRMVIRDELSAYPFSHITVAHNHG
jgi:hypothetical protein